MADYGTDVTDKALKKLDKEIQEVYGEAARDIQKKLDDFMARAKVKNAMMQEKLKSGEITKDQYLDWKAGQLFQGQQWKLKKYNIEQVLASSNKAAINMINNESVHVFEKNWNYQDYKLENEHKVDFGFEIYDSNAVANLLKNNPRVLPKYKVDEPKDYVWNGKKVDRQIAQGIIQGETLDQIAKRLAKNLSSQNMNHMKMFARTAMTSAQNAGRYQGLSSAKDIGLEVVKEWMATLDLHTRDTHRHMDGEQQKVGDKWHPFKFSNGCRFPGDPEGPPREVYNCRCTLVGDLANFPSEYKRYDNIDGKPIENMSYDEWYKAKQAQKAHLKAVANAEAELKKLGKIEDVEKEIEDLEKAIQLVGADKVLHGIWKEDVTYANWEEKKDSIQAKRDYYKERISQVREKIGNNNLSEWDPDAREELMSIILDNDQFLDNDHVPSSLVADMWVDNKNFLQGSLGLNGSEFVNIVDTLDNASVLLRKYTRFLTELDTFEKYGAQWYNDFFKPLKEAKELLAKMRKLQDIINGNDINFSSPFGADAYSKERKDKALWTSDQQKVDDVLRPLTIEVWQKSNRDQKDAIYEYTKSYHKYNEPLRGIEYGTSRFLGVGNTDLNAGSANNGRNLNNMTDIIDKSKLKQDQWFQRGNSYSGSAKFLGVDLDFLMNASEEDLKKKLLGTTPTEYGFMSMGSAKGAGFSGDVHFYIYAPKGTKAMYVEPFSAFGGGYNWDGKSKQKYFGGEFETILQQGTQFRVTRVRKDWNGVHVDIEVIGQDKPQRWKG